MHSIQSSINLSSDDQPEHTPQVSVIMRIKNPPNDSALPDILNNSGNTKSGEKVRPRSCVNPSISNALLNDDCSNGSGGSSGYDQTRRWSGVQLGSKLMQAFDRLALYDDSEDYTDSLEHDQHKNSKREQHETHDEVICSNILTFTIRIFS